MRVDKAPRRRTLNCEPLETRRLLAGDMAADCTAAPPDAVAETASVVEDNVPPTTQNRSRASAGIADGAQERPGRGWEDSVDEAASAIVQPVAADIAIAAEDSDPPETQNRGRISDEVGDSDGAHQRPGRGWD